MGMPDTIERLGRSTIQHGPLNRRIYVIKLHRDDVPDILGDLDALTRREGYEKIVVKAPATLAELFVADGYRKEAAIPGFFGGRETMAFMSKFTAKTRLTDGHLTRYRSMLATIDRKKPPRHRSSISDRGAVIRCRPADAGPLSRLYGQVFISYPFPIDDPAFLRRAMKHHVDYYAVRHRGQLVAAAAAEKDLEHGSVEMTDFATVPVRRARGLGTRLLAVMEGDMADIGLTTSFSIARAASFGMNAVFGKQGYRCGGLLINNTNIAGRIESMTVWYKHLPAKADSSA